MSYIQDPLQPNTLQSILDKIGMGKAQFILSRSLVLLLFSQGCESIVLGLLLPQLSKDWQLTTFQKSLLISAVYFGVTIGSYIQTFSDQYGRHIFIILDAILQSIFGILSCICVTYQQFLISRFFYGVGIGIILPLSGAYLSQITPSYFRAKMLSISRVSWSLGCLFACLLGWMLMEGRHWRIILFIICIPGIYAVYDQWINGKQSIRYLWLKRENVKVKQVLDFMCEKNQVEKISLDLINQLISKQQQQKAHLDHTKQGSFRQLFNQKYFFSTIYLLFAWFTVCFIYYGIMLLLPTILSNYTSFSNNFQYFFIFCISLVEILAFYGASYFSDHQYFGRKKSVYFGMIIIAISTIYVMLLSQTDYLQLLIGYVVIKCFITLTFMILYPYTAQVYETMLRGTAMGYTSVIGRFGSIMIGMIGLSSLEWLDGNGLYLIFVSLSLISALFMFKMPYDTLGRALDQ